MCIYRSPAMKDHISARRRVESTNLVTLFTKIHKQLWDKHAFFRCYFSQWHTTTSTPFMFHKWTVPVSIALKIVRVRYVNPIWVFLKDLRTCLRLIPFGINCPVVLFKSERVLCGNVSCWCFGQEPDFSWSPLPNLWLKPKLLSSC